MADEFSSPARRTEGTVVPHDPRTFTLGVINGVLFRVASTFIDPTKVLSAFILRLTGSEVWVGVMAAFSQAGFLWPQLLVSHVAASSPRKMPLYYLSAAARLSAWGLWLAALLLWTDQPSALGVAFLLLYPLYTSAIGLGGVPFMDIISKTIPPQRRGRFFALRSFFGGLLGFSAGFVIRYVLSERSGLSFPWNYFILFGGAYLLLLASQLAFCLIREPPGPVSPRRENFLTFLRHGPRLLRADPDFRGLLIWRAWTSFSLMPRAFFVPYALRILGAQQEHVGLFVSVGVLSTALSVMPWGRVGDEQGNRRLLIVTGILRMFVPLLALLTPLVPKEEGNLRIFGFNLHLTLPVAFFLLVVALGDATLIGSSLGSMNYLIELGTPAERPIYLGFMNTFSAPLVLAPLIGGLILKLASFPVLFIVALGCSLCAVHAAYRLREPREWAE
ncbi:MAG TPA: MFS transporter [Armatimonadetes bacterium]|nr:MFS transporter [Armatimonadota bacterium]